MKKYEIGLVFFIDQTEDYNKSIEIKDNLLDALDETPEIDSYDVISDGEDWNIECTAIVSSKKCQRDNISKALEKALQKAEKTYLDENISCTWDYHYIKGIDNDFEWQP